MVRSYLKGYRAERLAINYMRRKYGALCVRSAGSHGACDLLCGNGREIFAVQVKAGKRRPPVSWKALEKFARMFKARPLVLYKPDRRPFVEITKDAFLRELGEKGRSCAPSTVTSSKNRPAEA